MTIDQTATVVDVLFKVLAIAGLFLYATVRLGIDTFYNVFEVTPEEVGLTQATIIGRAAVYLFAAIALLATGGVLALFVWSIFERTASTMQLSFSVGYLAVLAVTFWRGPKPDVGRPFIHFATFIAASLALIIGTTFVIIGISPVVSGVEWYSGYVAIFAIGLVFVMFAFVGMTWLEGRMMAGRVLNGVEVKGQLLNLQAFEVKVIWTDGDVPSWLDTSRPYLYLGEGDRWLVLFDPESLARIRIPHGKAAVVSTHSHWGQAPR